MFLLDGFDLIVNKFKLHNQCHISQQQHVAMQMPGTNCCKVLLNHSFVVTMLIIAPYHAMDQVNLLDETLRITKMVLTKFMANFIKHKCVH